MKLSIGHRLWRCLPPVRRRQVAARAASLLAPKPDRVPPPALPGLAVLGAFSHASGLGEAARLMVQAARALDVPVWALDVPPLIGGPAELPFQSDALPPPGVPLVAHINAPQWPMALLRLPRALIRGRRVIGHWSWELPVVPPEWRAGVPFVHEIWALSHFTAQALDPLLPGRVRVVPPAMTVAPPEASALDRAAFGWPAGAVVVLVSFDLASSFARKNPLAAIAAFREAFGTRMDRLLVLKIGHADHAPEDFARIAEAARAPNIRLETRMLPSGDRHAMTRAADIVLSLHRAEGLGLVPAEAMFFGRAVVATGWSGNMDFMDETSAALVPYRLVPAVDPRQVYHGACWAEADIGAAAAHLRRLAGDELARASLGAAAKLAVRRHMDTSHLAAALRAIAPGFGPVSPASEASGPSSTV